MNEKSQAQSRADRIHAFRAELAELEREGALRLDEAQHAALDQHLDRTLRDLAARFDIDTTQSQKQVSWGMRIVSTLGAVALCASVVMFLQRFWGDLPIPAQVFVLALTPILLVAATDFAAKRERTLYYASLLSLVAFAAFVANLNILGVIFNLTPASGAMLAWGAFGIVLAYTYGVRLVLVAGLGCLAGYVAALMASWWGGYWLPFIEKPEHFFPAIAILFAVPRLPRHRGLVEFNRVYVTLGIALSFLALLILSENGRTSYLPWGVKPVEVLYDIAAFLAGGAVTWLGVRRRSTAMAYAGAGFLFVLLNLRFFHWWWDWMPGYLFFLVIGLIAVALLALFRRLRRSML